MYGICEKCYGIIDLSTHRNEWWDDYICVHCNELSAGIQIDELILPTISILNQKGYKTKFCCSGHPLDGNPESDTVNNFYIFFDKGCEPSKAPKNVDVEYDLGGVIYRKIFSSDVDYFRIFELILDFNKQIYKWAKKLPERKI